MNSKLSVEEQLSSLTIDKEIIEEAIRIYKDQLIKLKNLLKRGNLSYLALMEAYKSKGVPPNMTYIKSVYHLSNPQIKKTLKVASRNGYSLILHRYNPKDFLGEFCRIVGIHEDHIPNISSICDKLLAYNDHNYEIKPQNIAATAVLYYAQNKGYTLDIKLYSKQTGVAKSSMETIKKEIVLSDITNV